MSDGKQFRRKTFSETVSVIDTVSVYMSHGETFLLGVSRFELFPFTIFRKEVEKFLFIVVYFYTSTQQ